MLNFRLGEGKGAKRRRNTGNLTVPKENSLIRTQAIVDMANSFKLATNAIVRKMEETNGVDNSQALVRKL